MQSIKDLWRGITQNRWKTARYVFTAFSVLFTIIRGVTHFVPGVKIEGPLALFIVVVVSFGYGLKKIWKPSMVEIKIANTNTTIEVIFGDIFQQDGIRAIAVTEFFDSEFGKPVSEKSLHGLFLKKCFGGGVDAFDKQVDEQLLHVEGTETNKVEGKTKCFPIGTCVMVIVDHDRYLVPGRKPPAPPGGGRDVPVRRASARWPPV